ncbi:nuclear transport factor 2 family protein [Rhodohalobacter sp.]|uniref:nuclear transport factor 2 family protein n=1 Tax=Rhodohalobacter sp. TaxID=1974210 RepID=UPI002ACE91CB|nr:nuclear transport factor 2 family protein [Rhodohalobacter sp.]MDZ7755052.1 nuclear transport factor 2 family protein [Rhodohalobacter sp.]
MNNKLQRTLSGIAVLSLSIFMTNCSQVQSDNPNVEIVQGIYDAFAVGDGAAVVATFSPDIIWNEAESNSLAEGNPYIGPQAVAEGVFGRIGQEWETFTLHDQTLYAVGEDMVLVTGRYRGTHASTGKSIDAQKVHIWWFEDGLATRFQQYVDTKQLADAEME